jgi:hypothetical protein
LVIPNGLGSESVLGAPQVCLSDEDAISAQAQCSRSYSGCLCVIGHIGTKIMSPDYARLHALQFRPWHSRRPVVARDETVTLHQLQSRLRGTFRD